MTEPPTLASVLSPVVMQIAAGLYYARAEVSANPAALKLAADFIAVTVGSQIGVKFADAPGKSDPSALARAEP